MTKFYALTAAFVLLAVIGGTAVYSRLGTSERACNVSNAVGAAIGGPFELLNASGELVTDADILDKPALVYFGYTFCPDVCPFDVARNAEAVDLLNEMGHSVTPVFITIDPSRDTPEVLADYQFNMHSDLIALTGTDEQIRDAAQAYKVYYSRGAGDDDFYLMDHSVFTYLMLPGNELAAYFNRQESAEAMAEKTACLLE